MEHILLLDEDETIGSILNKVDSMATPRAAIVAGGHEGPLHNPVWVRLLQRRARDRAMQLAVISDDEFTRWLCEEAGFQTYSTVDAFQDGMWSPGGKITARLRAIPFGSWLSRAIAAVLLGLLALVLYLVLPAADVTIAPASRAFALDVPITADVQQSDVDAANGRIPASVVSTEIDGQRTVRATAERDAPDKTATGTVTFTNPSTAPVQVPKGTTLLAGPKQYETTVEATVPAAVRVGESSIKGTAIVPVQATTGGTDGNGPAGSITAVSGPLEGKVAVVNTQAIAGGTNKKAAFLSADDQNQAKEALRAELVQQGLDQIHSQLQRNMTFLPNPQTQTDDAVELLNFDQTPEQVASSTTLHMRVLVKGLTFVGDDVNAVVDQAMRSAVRRASGALTLTSDPLAIDPPVVAADDGSTIKLQVHATGQVSGSIDASRLVDGIRGMSQSRAVAYLRALPGIGNAQVNIWPSFAGRVPRFAWRIHLRQIAAVRTQG